MSPTTPRSFHGCRRAPSPAFLRIAPALLVLALAVPGGAVLGAESAPAPAVASEAAAPHGEVTTIYIVRHAEKVDGSASSGLTPNGQARAEELARILQDEALDAVYSTPFRRTLDTAAPAAAGAGVDVREYDPRDSAALAERVLSEPGHRVLVVGHSNTLDDLAAAFGAEGLSDLDESEYDHLFVVHRWADGGAHLDRLRFGPPDDGR